MGPTLSRARYMSVIPMAFRHTFAGPSHAGLSHPRPSGRVTAVRVGAGGWGYFGGGLASYARAFDFVEVNVTFYRHILEATARRWRSSVPPDFVFAVKAHHDATHRARMRPTASARAALAQTSRVARILRSPYVILETPPSLAFGREEIAGLREFAAIAPDGVRLGLEARAHALGTLPPPLARAMEDLGILDVVDLSSHRPRVSADALYTRVFGKGTYNAYQLDDTEMRQIDHVGREATSAAYAFHGVRMYKDAARFLTFRRTGLFPPATESVGLDSLAEVLTPDARFPATREDLLRDHGWKVIDLDEDQRVHADAYLARLPVATYRTLHEVLAAVGSSLALIEPRGTHARFRSTETQSLQERPSCVPL